MKKWQLLIAITAFVFCFVLAGKAGQAATTLDWSGNIDVNLTQKDPNGSSTSGLALDEATLNLGAKVNENVAGTLVIKYEDGADIFLDEGYLTLSKLGNMPLNLIAGKRVQPLGVFESHLINDPFTLDHYEINTSGATLTYTPENMMGLEVGLTAYSNDGLFTSSTEMDPNITMTDEKDPDDLDDDEDYRAPNPEYKTYEDDLGNFILHATIAPIEMIKGTIYYASEQGDNDTGGLSVTGSIQNLTLDAEYISALKRADNDNDGKDDGKESAFFVAAAYQVIPTFSVAARYDAYDDDNDKDDPGVIESRLGLGFGYEIFENASFNAEYNIQTPEDGDDINELILQVSLEY